MIDIKFLVNNKEAVKENIKKKFQDDKLPLVDEAAELYAQILEAKQAPVENQEEDLHEAQFADTEEEKTFSDTNDTLVSWLTYKK